MTYYATTHLAQVHPQALDPQIIALAAQVIRDGGLVAFPTETVYGLGANALNSEAVAKIFLAKERPATDPLIVHISDLSQLEQVAQDIPPIAYTLAEHFWAGALTLVLKKQAAIPPNVSAGQATVAVRMPNHLVALSLIREAGVPIAAPSANRFSRPSPTSALHVLQDLNGRVDLILDGGSTEIGVESTIIDLTSPSPMILRPGGVALEALREYLPSLVYRPRVLAEDELAPASGMLLKHYSPNAHVQVYAGAQNKVLERMKADAQAQLARGRKVGILSLDSEAAFFQGAASELVMLGTDLTAFAAQLFAGLRELDSAQMDVILVAAPAQAGLGLAIYDRLFRAAEGQVIQVD